MEREMAVERLAEIKEQLKELVEEAYDLVRGTDRNEGDRARAYWYGQMVSSLDDEHYFVGRTVTLKDSIDALCGDDAEEAA